MNADEEIAAHAERNEKLLKRLGTRGVDLDAPRSVEHHFWAHSQKDAALLARELYAKGYLILALMPTGEPTRTWSIDAGISRSPISAASDAVTKSLVQLALRFNAEYDGWGTSI